MDSASKQQSKDMVTAVEIIVRFIKGQDYKGVIVESRVGQEEGQETRGPLAGIGNCGVMTIALDVGSVGRVVGEVTGLEVCLQLRRGTTFLPRVAFLKMLSKLTKGLCLRW